ncbi:MAG: SpoIIE family protein phosphatase [Acidobacteria bacterium]|nr:SpoIIE family protein phosphatase [Acidobacteriota bacterium]MCB9377200.1 SpoIIE family protein phosphatase [Holophagales bacterium]
MPRTRLSLLLSIFGALAFLLALLSIVDILVPRPYDGVVLETDAPGSLRVREVLLGSGAERAGILPGDRIVGIDRTVLRSTGHAAALLARRDIGDSVPYLVRRGESLEEVQVELGRRFIGSASYLFACLLGFSIFGVGLFVRSRQREMRAAQIFFLLSALFLLFLVCRLRPASYGWIDGFVLEAGALALVLLPASFLHFFLVFPTPVPLRPRGGEADFASRRRRWVALLWLIYLVPAAVAALAWIAELRGVAGIRFIAGAPAASWWVLGIYFLLGLAALRINASRLTDPRQRRGVGLVLFGTLLGLGPFLAIAVARPAWLHTDPLAFAALVPLALVPITFAVAIIRFGLLDIRVIVRRSLFYTAVTALVAVVYAAALGLFNAFALGSRLAASPYFPLLLTLAVLLLFEPLRLRSLAWLDRFVLGDRWRLQEEVRELGRAISAQVDLQPVVRELVERLPRMLGLHFAALYLMRDGELVREAGPDTLPERLASIPGLHEALAERRTLVRLADLRNHLAGSAEAVRCLDRLEPTGVEWVTDLTSPRRRIGLVLLSAASGQIALGEEELALLDSLFGQAAIALEASLLLAERTRQAELERELEIASTVQSELLPRQLHFGPGWRVAAICRPARHVGGDFFAELPGRNPESRAIVFGDVAGKSVAGALRMMAAHEALQSLALTHRDPEALFELVNRRLHGAGGKKSFVALAYLAATDDGGVEYLMAGQPELLVRSRDGAVRGLPLQDHRLPVGALREGRYVLSRAPLEPGDLILGYSDGVIEAQSPSGEFFGDERLAETLSAAPPEPDGAIAAVLGALADFTRGSEPYDDITLVALARGGEGEA